MMKKRYLHFYNFFLTSLLSLLGFNMVGSCGLEYGPETEEYGPPVLYGPPPVEAEYDVDREFTPTEEYLQHKWTGEYKGWRQTDRLLVTRRRMLDLQPGGRFVDVLSELSTSGGFKVIQSYEGSYVYDADAMLIRYTVETADGIQINAVPKTEQLLFTEMKNGKRSWIAIDPTLHSLQDNSYVSFEMTITE